MKKMRLFLLPVWILLFTIQVYSQDVNFLININSGQKTISPFIYGANPEFTSEENLGSRRLGGNRLTGYNWENNASHAGTDWYNYNDNYMASGLPNPNAPGATLTAFNNEALGVGAYSAITLQMAGYVARDKNGTSVTEAQTAPSSRWNRVQFVKGSAFSLAPDLNDSVVYMDECVNFLVNTYGTANTSSGVKGYILDNEPALWPSTHPRIHPNKPTCNEIIQKGIELSNAVKSIDPYAEIFGPALYGFAAFYNFQDAADWNSVKQGKGYSWFIDYYLDEMEKAETTYGKRLLDVLDIHWYPEAYGDNRITETYATTNNDKAARLQAPRTLWDSKYEENSWIINAGFSAFFPLIPKIQESIDKYYPETKISITEFTYGGEDDITGGIATSDVLGIFGKYGVYMASFWPVNDNTAYVQSAYRIFRNYDGQKSTFGDISTAAYTSDSVYTSIYSSIKTGTNEIHLIAINKNLSASRTANISIQHDKSVLSGNAWVLDNSGTEINNAGSISGIQSNSFSYTMPAGSVSHIVLQTSVNTGVNQIHSNLPSVFKLDAFPNPFNLSCNIQYNLPDNSSKYSLEIRDIMGRLVKTYGINSNNGYLIWDGTNEKNQTVTSGAYFVLVKSSRQLPLTKRIILLK
ncbi:MAG: T9SS type A sorting domain-containing protein [Bacteroidetes bacterium]|nr:T9SS type A sorting domain-containing protein [Bacteroidota bacterium]